MTEVGTDQLVQIIGHQQVEISVLKAQLEAMMVAYEEQRKILQGQAETQPEPQPKKGKKS